MSPIGPIPHPAPIPQYNPPPPPNNNSKSMMTSNVSIGYPFFWRVSYFRTGSDDAICPARGCQRHGLMRVGQRRQFVGFPAMLLFPSIVHRTAMMIF